jgi:hypothetical protein
MDSRVFSILGIGLEADCAMHAMGDAMRITRLQERRATLEIGEGICGERERISIVILRHGR